ncbi:MAG: hypothetical protein NC412_01065 [Roseburia sp.]|nr:hypothetical protein [Roseburia sp.]MCM1277923.1 hypothetical protein [Robinsoniella sp.]
MGALTFANVKVHNEIEFCKVSNPEVKQKIERAFLNNRISYYERWEDISLFKRIFGDKDKQTCIICINSMQKDKAETLVEEMPEIRGEVELCCRRVDKTFF